MKAEQAACKGMFDGKEIVTPVFPLNTLLFSLAGSLQFLWACILKAAC